MMVSKYIDFADSNILVKGFILRFRDWLINGSGLRNIANFTCMWILRSGQGDHVVGSSCRTYSESKLNTVIVVSKE